MILGTHTLTHTHTHTHTHTLDTSTAVQIENEFGQFGDVLNNPQDMRYLRHLIHLARDALGPHVILYTTDFGNLENMMRGSIQGSEVLTAGDFGPTGNLSESFAAQKLMNPAELSPPFCSEFYAGWYTGWGYSNTTRTDTRNTVATLHDMLSTGWSVSMYMVHGGTNFGYMGGANIQDEQDAETGYLSLITSYDYSSPITESGDHGIGSDNLDKYAALRNLLLPYTHTAFFFSLSRSPLLPAPFPEPPPQPKAAYGRVHLSWRAGFWENLAALAPKITEASAPLPFETIGAAYGYVLYSTSLESMSSSSKNQVSLSHTHTHTHTINSGAEWRASTIKPPSLAESLPRLTPDPLIKSAPTPSPAHHRTTTSTHVNITVDRVHDRAHLFLDHLRVGILERGGRSSRNFVTVPRECMEAATRLDVLVENLGRVNFGPHLADRKGLLGNVRIGEHTVDVYTHTRMYIWIYTHVYLRIHLCTCVFLHAHTHTRMCVCIYRCLVSGQCGP